jgi:hypothetical protein
LINWRPVIYRATIPARGDMLLACRTLAQSVQGSLMTLPTMLKSLVLLVICGLPVFLSAAGTDAELKSRLVGTWQSQFEWKDADNPDYWVTSRGQDTYRADGRVHGASVSRRGGQEECMEYTGRWDIREGSLVVEVTAATGGYVSTETVTRDRIIRLDDVVLTLETVDGIEVMLQRAPLHGNGSSPDAAGH